MRRGGRETLRRPADQSKHPKWQTAMHVLIEAAEGCEPVVFTRLGYEMGPTQASERPMTNAEILAQVILDIETALAEHLEPDHWTRLNCWIGY